MRNTVHRSGATKETCLANGQQNSRACARLHCTYAIQPVSRSEPLPADVVIDIMAEKLAISKAFFRCKMQMPILNVSIQTRAGVDDSSVT